jgi:hypothetical protein
MPVTIRHLSIIAACGPLLLSSIASAQAPRDLGDLVGARAAGGETQLEERGYVHIKTQKGDDRAWSYWWQPKHRACVSVAVFDGRFDAITTTPAADCNQGSAKADGKDGSGAAAAAAIGVALVGVAALAHSSHNHDNGKHLDDEATDSQFERGYRDGLYAQSYHNYDRADAYSDGYSKGVAQRGNETRHRDGHADDAGGYRASVNVNDLVTQRAASADVELQKRGFRTVNAYQAGDSAYTIRSNERTGQCVQVAVKDGRIRYIAAIKPSACR